MTIVNFSNVKQNNPAWAGYQFGHAGETFASSACGLFSICILLNRTTTAEILEVYRYLDSNGWATDHSGTWQCGIYKTLQHFGVQAEQITSESIGKRHGTPEMARAREHGKTMALCMLTGSKTKGTADDDLWTSGGHYVAVVGYDPKTDRYLVHDPANRNDGWHDWEDFEGDTKHVFLVYKSYDGSSVGKVEVKELKIYKNIKQVKSDDKGLEVLLLQEILASRGIKSDKKYGGSGEALKLDQSFGKETKSALMHYQEQRKLTVDGICGPASWCDLLGGI